MTNRRTADAASWMWLARVAGMAATALALTGCGSFYVDTATKDVPVAQYQKPAQPKPVQLMFEFQTKGALNTRATDALKAQIGEHVKTSGLFSEVQDKAVPNGAMLSIVLNNVPVDDNAFGKGFVTGLTFGLAGSQVTDGYICTATYVTPGQVAPVVKTARHAIHTTLGASAAPPNAVKSESLEAAVRTMTRQIISTTLNDLSAEVAR
jgi:hypothetical protein